MEVSARRPARAASLAVAALCLLVAGALPALAGDRSEAPRNSLWFGVGVTGVTLDPTGTAYWVTTEDHSVMHVDRVTGAALGPALAGPDTLLSCPRQPAIGPGGELVVPNYCGGDTVTFYPPDAGGNVQPSHLLVVGLSQPSGVAFDAAGRLYTANYGNDSVTVHAPNAQPNDPPERTIAGPQTGLTDPTSVAVGPDGELYVATFSPGTVRVFAPGASGDVAPTRVITYDDEDADTTPDNLAGAEAVALDSSGHLYVTLLPGEVLVFPAGADGPSTPLVRLSGPDTGLQSSLDLVVEPDRSVSVANDMPMTVTTHDPLVPFTVPSKVRHLVVRGKADARRRTVDWRAPADNGGQPVSRYDLVVTKKGKVVLTRTVHDTDAVLRRAELPRGSLTVEVDARNATGAGPAASRDFTVRR